MSHPSRLTEPEIAAALAQVPEWERRDDRIVRSLRLATFADTIAFMASLVEVIDRLDHHPEWTNVYNRLDIELTTHDVNGLSSRDFEVAAEIDRAYSRLD